MTKIWGCMASRLRAMSLKDSPFVILEVDGEILRTSAERRLAASSKEVRVRVEDSIKRLITVRPRSVGTFLIKRSVETFFMEAAVSRIKLISFLVRSSMDNRSFFLNDTDTIPSITFFE